MASRNVPLTERDLSDDVLSTIVTALPRCYHLRSQHPGGYWPADFRSCVDCGEHVTPSVCHEEGEDGEHFTIDVQLNVRARRWDGEFAAVYSQQTQTVTFRSGLRETEARRILAWLNAQVVAFGFEMITERVTVDDLASTGGLIWLQTDDVGASAVPLRIDELLEACRMGGVPLGR